MAAPSKSFTAIANTEIDADSPLTEGLFTKFRDNDIYLEEWLGRDFVAAVNHFHDGVDSKKVDALAGGTGITNLNVAIQALIDTDGRINNDDFTVVTKAETGVDVSFIPINMAGIGNTASPSVSTGYMIWGGYSVKRVGDIWDGQFTISSRFQNTTIQATFGNHKNSATVFFGAVSAAIRGNGAFTTLITVGDITMQYRRVDDNNIEIRFQNSLLGSPFSDFNMGILGTTF